MFIMILLGIVFGVLALLLGLIGVRAVMDKREFGRAFPTRGMSIPSKKLFFEYAELPKDSRPFPDIVSVLTDLDEFHSTDADIAGHFNRAGRWDDASYIFSWNAGSCGHLKCRPSDYVELHRAIESVSKAVADKERAFIEAKVAHKGEAAKQLAEALRQEAGIQRQIVEELV